MVCDTGAHRHRRKYPPPVRGEDFSKCAGTLLLSPCYEERRKVRGDWRTLQRILFPGYVFLITEQVEQLYMELKKVIGLTRLLGTGDEVIALTERETDFLRKFGGEEQIVKNVPGNHRRVTHKDSVRSPDGNGGTDPKDRPAQAESMAGSGNVRQRTAGGSRTGNRHEDIMTGNVSYQPNKEAAKRKSMRLLRGN